MKLPSWSNQRGNCSRIVAGLLMCFFLCCRVFSQAPPPEARSSLSPTPSSARRTFVEPGKSAIFVSKDRLAGGHRGFQRGAARLWHCLHPTIQVKTGSGHSPFGVGFATNVLYAVADLLLVNIQSDVIHRSHEEPPWCL